MTSAQTLRVCRRENRCTLFRIMRDQLLDDFGRTEWNIDFVAVSMSSTTLVFSRAALAAIISARRSSGGRAVGIAAGGVGRVGASGRAAAA